MKMNMKKFFENKQDLGCIFLQLAILTFLVGFHHIPNVLIGIAAAFFLYQKNIFNKLKKTFLNVYVWLLASYFFLTLLGFLYSSDLKVASKFLEMRILILALPIIFSVADLTNRNYKKILRTFAYGVIMALFFGLSYSLYLYNSTGDTGYFFNDNLTLLINNQAVYFAVYVNISIIILLFRLQDKPNQVLDLTFLGILIVFQFLLATRISVLTLLLILIITAVYLVKNHRSKLVSKAIIGTVLLILISLSLMPQTRNRFSSMLSNFEYKFDNPNDVNHFNAPEIRQENWNGLTIRLALWDCGLRVIKDNFWIGVGTGDYDEKYREKLEEVNFVYAIKQNFGVHNQYLYTWISFGVFGLLIFILSLLIPSIQAIKDQNLLFIGVVSIFLIAFISENILNRYFGVFPFTLLVPLIFYQKRA